jgi:hypothetical protein
LRDIIEKAQEVEEAGNSLNLKELHASLEEAAIISVAWTKYSELQAQNFFRVALTLCSVPASRWATGRRHTTKRERHSEKVLGL